MKSERKRKGLVWGAFVQSCTICLCAEICEHRLQKSGMFLITQITPDLRLHILEMFHGPHTFPIYPSKYTYSN